MSSSTGYEPLSAYGIVGNLETAALVGRDGAVDWWCLPHVESPSVCARLLDSQRGGHFTVQPTREFESLHRYADRTNVLRTEFETTSGTATLTDFMPVPEAASEPASTHQALYRKVGCDSGHVEIGVTFEPRFDYARTIPTVERRGDGVVATADGEPLYLSGAVSVEIAEGTARGSVTLTEGDTEWLVCSYGRAVPHRPTDHDAVLADTIDFWHEWVHDCPDSGACPIDGPGHDLAVRSALVLKLLIHRESGAIAAAPTTSLPETVGGVRNWDYRYNWIRDSAFTVQALAELGHLDEARDYFDLCLAHCSRGDPADIQPVYGLHGHDDLGERTLDHLSGYRNSAPVRVGNAAHTQHQLDVYGELILGIDETRRYGATVTDDDWERMRPLIDYVSRAWHEPDVGIWEIRDDPRQFVYSKVMCWVALDRGLDIAAEFDFEAPTARWRTVRDEIKATVLDRGYSDAEESFVRTFGTDHRLDAATLLLPVVGFLPPDDRRVQDTIDAICDRLLTDGGLVRRYEGPDGLPGEEGAFVVCSFWLVNALALAGRTAEATELFRTVTDHVSPLGLLAEEVDPESGEQLGNVPQAFSQIGLITSAIYLDPQTGAHR